MRRATTRNILLLFASLLALAWLISWQVGCETFGGALAETRAAAADAQEAARAAQEAAEASGDPEAIKLAEEAQARANALGGRLADLEAKAAEWAAKYESGELGATEGADMGGTLGGLFGPVVGTIGTLVGGVLGGMYYRNRARQIIAAIDAGKLADPALDQAFGSDLARKAISGAMSPSTWKFVEAQRT